MEIKSEFFEEFQQSPTEKVMQSDSLAKMMDDCPGEYAGEKKVWEQISKMYHEIVCYFNRDVDYRQFDFLLLIKEIGFVVIEVKGWHKSHVVSVKSPDAILLADGQEVGSPAKQAKGYRKRLLDICKAHYSLTPLVLDLVCYPFLSEGDYQSLGLHCVSEAEYTLFKEDIDCPEQIYTKIQNAYREKKKVKHDDMTGDNYERVRYYFEPSDFRKPPVKKVIPDLDSGAEVIPYSRLSVIADVLSAEETDELVQSYFNGTKQIVFTERAENVTMIADRLVVDRDDDLLSYIHCLICVSFFNTPRDGRCKCDQNHDRSRSQP